MLNEVLKVNSTLKSLNLEGEEERKERKKEREKRKNDRELDWR